METYQICKSSYNTVGQNYLSIIGITIRDLSIIAVTLWSSVVLLSILELVFIQARFKITNFDDKLALLLAAVLFTAGLFYLCYAKFDKYNFCLMNRNDPYCGEAITSCFSHKGNSVIADNFGFGGFIQIKSGLRFVLRVNLMVFVLISIKDFWGYNVQNTKPI